MIQRTLNFIWKFLFWQLKLIELFRSHTFFFYIQKIVVSSTFVMLSCILDGVKGERDVDKVPQG